MKDVVLWLASEAEGGDQINCWPIYLAYQSLETRSGRGRKTLLRRSRLWALSDVSGVVRHETSDHVAFC